MASSSADEALLGEPPADSRQYRRVDFPWHHHSERQSQRTWLSPVTKLWRSKKASFRKKKQDFSWLDWATLFLPFLAWMRTYNIRTMLVGDITAGVSVGFMDTAQGLSYATLAGVPAVIGLYGAFIPCMAYALVGTSRQLAVGPVAVTSILIGANMKTIVPCAADITNANQLTTPDQVACQDLYNTKVIQLAFVVACLYTGVGVLRLGWITNFLSHAVISGFTSGAAIIIGLSQVKYILGYNIKTDKDNLPQLLSAYIDNVYDFKWQEFIMGSTLLILLVVMKELGKRVKRLSILRTLGPITACVIGLMTVMIWNVDQLGIRTIGYIPAGLPPVTIDKWVPIDDFGSLFPIAIVVMLVDLLESTSIARALARKNGYELNYNQEIVGLGLANFAGAAFSAYTTTGSFSRSAVNDLSGAKSPLAQFFTAWVIGLVLLLLTSVFSNLPYNVLGAVVVASVGSLLEYEQLIYLIRVSKLDALVWLASFLGTLFISVEIGLGIAIGLALLLAIYQTAFPHTAILGRVPGSSVYRNVKQYPNAQVVPGILTFRIDAPLYFANVKTLQDRLQRTVERMEELCERQRLPGLLYVIIDMTPVHHMDAMGMHFLEDLVFETRRQGQQLILANPSTKVLREMEPVKLAELVGREWIFVGVHDAMQYCMARMSERGLSVVPRRLDDVTVDSDNELSSAPPSDTDTSGQQLTWQSLGMNPNSSFTGRDHGNNGLELGKGTVTDTVETESGSSRVALIPPAVKK